MKLVGNMFKTNTRRWFFNNIESFLLQETVNFLSGDQEGTVQVHGSDIQYGYCLPVEKSLSQKLLEAERSL